MRVEPSGKGATSARIFWPAVAGAIGYDVITGDLASCHAGGGALDVGPMQVLARSTAVTSLAELPGGAGYGTESAPWLRVASTCEGGRPDALAPASGQGTNARR